MVLFPLQAEVNYLGQFSHPNLVKLIGYSCEDDHRLLVYEYMASGSLEKHLFRSKLYMEFANVSKILIFKLDQGYMYRDQIILVINMLSAIGFVPGRLCLYLIMLFTKAYIFIYLSERLAQLLDWRQEAFFELQNGVQCTPPSCPPSLPISPFYVGGCFSNVVCLGAPKVPNLLTPLVYYPLTLCMILEYLAFCICLLYGF